MRSKKFASFVRKRSLSYLHKKATNYYGYTIWNLCSSSSLVILFPQSLWGVTGRYASQGVMKWVGGFCVFHNLNKCHDEKYSYQQAREKSGTMIKFSTQTAYTHKSGFIFMSANTKILFAAKKTKLCKSPSLIFGFSHKYSFSVSHI